MWRRVISALATTTVMIGVVAAPASASVVDNNHYVIEEEFPETIRTDIPCLLGKEFWATGSVIIRGTFVDAGDEGFHFSQIEKWENTFVPVDGLGPTYVENGSVTHIRANARMASGVVTFTRVDNANFIAYEGGKVVSAAKIRVQEIFRIVATDTDADGVPDIIRVELEKADFSCP